MLAYKGMGIVSSTSRNVTITQKLTNLPKRSKLGFFALFFASVYFTLQALTTIQHSLQPLLILHKSGLKKGSLTSTSRLAPFSHLVRVSELSLSPKLALSLEGDKRLAERADDTLSACLRERFPSRFLLSTKRINASLSG